MTSPRPPILDILSNLKVAVAQLRLYPKDSPQVMGVATSAYQSVVAFVNESGSLMLSRTPRGLLINGRRLPATGEQADHLENATLKLLEDVRVKTLSFKKGLTIDELIAFLSALTRKFWDAKEGKEINAKLREERIYRISVDEVEYVAVGKGDLVFENAAAKLAGTGTKVAELMRSFDQLIETAVEEGAGSEVRLQIMKKLLEQDPTLLQRAQAEGLPGTGTDAPGWITFEQARQALGDLIALLRTASPEQRERLKRMGHIVVGGFRHDPTLLALIQKFLSDEAAELIPTWMRGAEQKKASESPAVARANSILAQEEDTQVRSLAKEAGGLAKELIAAERPDTAEEMVNALLGFVRDRSTQRRLDACDALEGIRASAVLLPDSVITAVENRVRSALLSEKEAAVYTKLADLTAAFIDARIRREELARAAELLETLKKHYQVKEAGFQQRVEIAFHALERIASGAGFSILMDKVQAQDPAAYAVVESLDAAATRFLIDRVKATENAAQRQRLCDALTKIGPSASAMLVEEVQKVATPTEGLRLLEVLPHAVQDTMAEVALRGLLRHTLHPLRRKAAALLAERSYARAASFLLDALKDEKDSVTRVSIVDALGRIRPEMALGTLCVIADSRSETDAVRISACTALGRIGNRAAITTLAKVATARLLTAAPPAVRAGAARALGQFASDPKAAEALRKVREDSDGSVKAAATDALNAPLVRAFGDLVREVQLVSAAQEVKTENWKLAGSLKEIPLDQIGQLVAGANRTGLLLLNFSGTTAKIWFENGIVVGAECDGRSGQAAVTHVFPQKDGVFLFQPGEAPPAKTIRSSIQQMLLEAARSADERKA